MTMFTVFGGAGYIGSRLVSSLRQRGFQVNAPMKGESEWIGKNLGHVIYAAGVTADFRIRLFDTVESHISSLCPILKSGGVDSFLYLSTTRVYTGQSCTQEDQELKVSPCSAYDFYNISKIMGEAICMQSQCSGVRVVRLSNVVGGDDMESPNFIPSLMRDAKNGKISLYTDLNSEKDYIHIEDVVQLLPRIAMDGRYNIYNVASGHNISHAQWVAYLQEMTGCQVEVDRCAPTQSFPVIDITRIQDEFGFRARPVMASVCKQN